MSQKAIVHSISKEVAEQSIETLKVRKETLEYLRKNKFRTIEDIVRRQERIPKNTEVISMPILYLGLKIRKFQLLV